MEEKSNIGHLKKILTDKNEEMLEFLVAVEKEHNELLKKVLLLEKQNEQQRISVEELELQLEKFNKGEGLAYEIDAGIGKIYYYADHLPLEYIMDAIEDKLATHSPNKITDHLNSL